MDPMGYIDQNGNWNFTTARPLNPSFRGKSFADDSPFPFLTNKGSLFISITTTIDSEPVPCSVEKGRLPAVCTYGVGWAWGHWCEPKVYPIPYFVRRWSQLAQTEKGKKNLVQLQLCLVPRSWLWLPLVSPSKWIKILFYCWIMVRAQLSEAARFASSKIHVQNHPDRLATTKGWFDKKAWRITR